MTRGRSGVGGDGGSVLILMPAAVLIVVMLGALAVDFAALHMAKRELASVAAGAANDAVTAGLDLNRYRDDGAYVLDGARVRAVIEQRLAAQANRAALRLTALEIDGPSVRLVVEEDVEPIFARALPGGQRMTVRATATATAATAAGDPGPAP